MGVLQLNAEGIIIIINLLFKPKMEKVKEGIGLALTGLKILTKRANDRNDTMELVIIMGIALALQKVCEATEEIEKAKMKVSSN